VSEQARQARKGRAAAGPPVEIPALEWAAAALGAVLLVAALGFMLREAALPAEPGPVEFRVLAVRPVGAAFLVEFEARNDGGTAYAELEVEGTVRGASGLEERAHATLDYLPRRSSRRGGFFFRSDPRDGEVEIVAKGFREP
jgi:uncharacterized protein (TIGR02588 family)